MALKAVVEHTDYNVHKIDGYICNLFLVEYEDKMLLLDCGSISDIKRVEGYCINVLGRPVSDIKLAIVSHSHPDHAGGAVIWRKKYGIPIAAHPRIDFWYEGPGGFLQHKVDCYLATWVAYRKKAKLERILVSRKVKPAFVLQDAAEVPFFPDWQVLHIPGHTINDIALYNRKEKTLYPGDCLMNLDGKLYLPIPILFPDKMEASFDRMADLDVNTILVAHGEKVLTSDPVKVFTYMKSLLDKPFNTLTSLAYRFSLYSPEYRKYKRHSQ